MARRPQELDGNGLIVLGTNRQYVGSVSSSSVTGNVYGQGFTATGFRYNDSNVWRAGRCGCDQISVTPNSDLLFAHSLPQVSPVTLAGLTVCVATSQVAPFSARGRRRQNKTPADLLICGCFVLATSYSRTACRRTTIGAAVFHFRVRNGNGWDRCAIVTRVRNRAGGFGCYRSDASTMSYSGDHGRLSSIAPYLNFLSKNSQHSTLNHQLIL